MISLKKLKKKLKWSLSTFGMNIKSQKKEISILLISFNFLFRLSGDMNNLYDLIQKTYLFDDLKLIRNILADAVPKTL